MLRGMLTTAPAHANDRSHISTYPGSKRIFLTSLELLTTTYYKLYSICRYLRVSTCTTTYLKSNENNIFACQMNNLRACLELIYGHLTPRWLRRCVALRVGMMSFTLTQNCDSNSVTHNTTLTI